MITIRQTLLVSMGVHIGAFMISWLGMPHQNAITLPIEIMFNSPPAPAAMPAPAAPAAPKVIEPPKKDIIPLKKKVKPARTTPVPKPAAPAPAPAPVTPAPTAAPAAPSASPPGPSSRISLDAKDFPYTYYTGMIVKKISRYWQWSSDFGTLKTVVYFKIDTAGAVALARVHEPSGDALFDQQALRAVRLASPFPPLPQEYPEKDLGVYFEFSYH